MNYFYGCAVFWEHAVFEFLGGEVVESGMEGGRVDLIEKLLEGIGVCFCLFLLFSTECFVY